MLRCCGSQALSISIIFLFLPIFRSAQPKVQTSFLKCEDFCSSPIQRFTGPGTWNMLGNTSWSSSTSKKALRLSTLYSNMMLVPKCFSYHYQLIAILAVYLNLKRAENDLNVYLTPNFLTGTE